jgi:hypothetical protein
VREPLDTSATSDDLLRIYASRWRDRAETAEAELARVRRERDGLRDACSWYLKPDIPIRTFAERDSIFRGKLAALADAKGATP